MFPIILKPLARRKQCTIPKKSFRVLGISWREGKRVRKNCRAVPDPSFHRGEEIDGVENEPNRGEKLRAFDSSSE